MAIPRPAAILLVTATFLAAAPLADAQTSLSNSPPTAVSTSSATTTTAQSTQPAQSSATLPRTGLDLTLELVLAASLLGAGAAARRALRPVTATLRE